MYMYMYYVYYVYIYTYMYSTLINHNNRLKLTATVHGLKMKRSLEKHYVMYLYSKKNMYIHVILVHARIDE